MSASLYACHSVKWCWRSDQGSRADLASSHKQYSHHRDSQPRVCPPRFGCRSPAEFAHQSLSRDRYACIRQGDARHSGLVVSLGCNDFARCPCGDRVNGTCPSGLWGFCDHRPASPTQGLEIRSWSRRYVENPLVPDRVSDTGNCPLFATHCAWSDILDADVQRFSLVSWSRGCVGNG